MLLFFLALHNQKSKKVITNITLPYALILLFDFDTMYLLTYLLINRVGPKSPHYRLDWRVETDDHTGSLETEIVQHNNLKVFISANNIYTSRAYATMSVSVCL